MFYSKYIKMFSKSLMLALLVDENCTYNFLSWTPTFIFMCNFLS